MKVRFLTYRSDGIEPGDVVELERNEAHRYVATGQAEFVEPESTCVEPRGEQAVHPPARKRSGSKKN